MAARRALACGIALVAFVVYLITLAPGLTWAHDGADGGDFAAAVVTGGVPHPPGYPTYMLLARLAAAVPVGDVALRLNLLSALCAAAAVGILFLVIRQSIAHAAPVAAAAALLFAFSPAFWSQAVITEVYSLNVLFVALVLYLCLPRTTGDADDGRFIRGPGRGEASSGLVGFLFGLGLGNHLTLSLLAPSVVALRWRGRGSTSLRQVASGVIGLGAGLAAYAYLPLAAADSPPVSWGDAQTLDGFVWMVTGGPYGIYQFRLPLEELAGRLAAWARLLIGQFGWIGLVLGLVGLWDLLAPHQTEAHPGRAEAERRIALASLAAFVLYSVYALGYRSQDSYLYLIPAFLVAALWLARGVYLLVSAATRWLAGEVSDGKLGGAAALLAALIVLLLPVLQLAVNVAANNLWQDSVARSYVSDVLAALPTDALVVTASDEHTFALWYGQAVAGRPDVLVVDRDLTQFAWYRDQLQRRAPALELVTIDDDRPEQFVAALVARAAGGRPVFLADDVPDLLQRFQWRKSGSLYRLVGPGT